MNHRLNDQAHRGYLIRKYHIADGYWIERDRCTIIRFVLSVEEAKRLIDELLD